MKFQTHSFPAKTPWKGQNLIVTFVLAALLMLFILLYLGRQTVQPEYELKIKELGGDAMLAYSTSEELGHGEILLVYGENMLVEDVNGQIIDYAELSIEDRIRVTIAPREKDPDFDRYLDPIIEKIVLLPDDSDEYI
jgi:hypothetical protein